MGVFFYKDVAPDGADPFTLWWVAHGKPRPERNLCSHRPRANSKSRRGGILILLLNGQCQSSRVQQRSFIFRPENVSLVVGDPELFQQLHVFLTKCFLRMVALLILNVTDDRVQL